MTHIPSGSGNDGTVRLGEFLVSIGAMSDDQVRQVLEAQAKSPEKLFGQIAIEKGFINDDAVDAFLQHKRDVVHAV
jgi:hypothetical protein